MDDLCAALGTMEEEYSSLGDFIDKAISRCVQNYDHNRTAENLAVDQRSVATGNYHDQTQSGPSDDRGVSTGSKDVIQSKPSALCDSTSRIRRRDSGVRKNSALPRVCDAKHEDSRIKRGPAGVGVTGRKDYVDNTQSGLSEVRGSNSRRQESDTGGLSEVGDDYADNFNSVSSAGVYDSGQKHQVYGDSVNSVLSESRHQGYGNSGVSEPRHQVYGENENRGLSEPRYQGYGVNAKSGLSKPSHHGFGNSGLSETSHQGFGNSRLSEASHQGFGNSGVSEASHQGFGNSGLNEASHQGFGNSGPNEPSYGDNAKSGLSEGGASVERSHLLLRPNPEELHKAGPAFNKERGRAVKRTASFGDLTVQVTGNKTFRFVPNLCGPTIRKAPSLLHTVGGRSTSDGFSHQTRHSRSERVVSSPAKSVPSVFSSGLHVSSSTKSGVPSVLNVEPVLTRGMSSAYQKQHPVVLSESSPQDGSKGHAGKLQDLLTYNRAVPEHFSYDSNLVWTSAGKPGHKKSPYSDVVPQTHKQTVPGRFGYAGDSNLASTGAEQFEHKSTHHSALPQKYKHAVVVPEHASCDRNLASIGAGKSEHVKTHPAVSALLTSGGGLLGKTLAPSTAHGSHIHTRASPVFRARPHAGSQDAPLDLSVGGSRDSSPRPGGNCSSLGGAKDSRTDLDLSVGGARDSSPSPGSSGSSLGGARDFSPSPGGSGSSLGGAKDSRPDLDLSVGGARNFSSRPGASGSSLGGAKDSRPDLDLYVGWSGNFSPRPGGNCSSLSGAKDSRPDLNLYVGWSGNFSPRPRGNCSLLSGAKDSRPDLDLLLGGARDSSPRPGGSGSSLGGAEDSRPDLDMSLGGARDSSSESSLGSRLDFDLAVGGVRDSSNGSSLGGSKDSRPDLDRYVGGTRDSNPRPGGGGGSSLGGVTVNRERCRRLDAASALTSLGGRADGRLRGDRDKRLETSASTAASVAGNVVDRDVAITLRGVHDEVLETSGGYSSALASVDTSRSDKFVHVMLRDDRDRLLGSSTTSLPQSHSSPLLSDEHRAVTSLGTTTTSSRQGNAVHSGTEAVLRDDHGGPRRKGPALLQHRRQAPSSSALSRSGLGTREGYTRALSYTGASRSDKTVLPGAEISFRNDRMGQMRNTLLSRSQSSPMPGDWSVDYEKGKFSGGGGAVLDVGNSYGDKVTGVSKETRHCEGDYSSYQRGGVRYGENVKEGESYQHGGVRYGENVKEAETKHYEGDTAKDVSGVETKQKPDRGSSYVHGGVSSGNTVIGVSKETRRYEGSASSYVHGGVSYGKTVIGVSKETRRYEGSASSYVHGGVSYGETVEETELKHYEGDSPSYVRGGVSCMDAARRVKESETKHNGNSTSSGQGGDRNGETVADVVNGAGSLGCGGERPCVTSGGESVVRTGDTVTEANAADVGVMCGQSGESDVTDASEGGDAKDVLNVIDGSDATVDVIECDDAVVDGDATVGVSEGDHVMDFSGDALEKSDDVVDFREVNDVSGVCDGGDVIDVSDSPPWSRDLQGEEPSEKAKRYYEDGKGAKPKESTDTTETFNVEVSKISSKRLAKWKKQRMSKDDGEDNGASYSKASRKPSRKEFQSEEEAGFLEFGPGEEVDNRLSQTDIVEAVDVTSATKHFDLMLKDFGPYNVNYTRSGRHLLLGGKKGHMAAFDWQTKGLHCEFNAMETVNSVRWLHQETLFATAQRSGVYVYDNQGVEIHALTQLDAVLRMEFLPYHMLLATTNEKGFLGYTDVSMGTRVAGICTGLGRLDVMTHNPENAVIFLGHAPGTVTLWTPNSKGPVMKMLCHKAPVRAITIDTTGNYMATSGVDKRIKVFDLRTYKPLSSTKVSTGVSSLDFSQRGLLAAALGAKVQVYKDVCRETSVIKPYLSHMCNGTVQQLEFCPFEDVLGVGHLRGFTSLIVPGSGEASIDAMEVNPYANKKQRQNAEVKLLLDKLQPEMIGLTNWVRDLSSAKVTRRPGASQKKKPPGKKEKEEAARERKRAAPLKTEEVPTDPSDPLSRFKKR